MLNKIHHDNILHDSIFMKFEKKKYGESSSIMMTANGHIFYLGDDDNVSKLIVGTVTHLGDYAQGH